MPAPSSSRGDLRLLARLGAQLAFPVEDHWHNTLPGGDGATGAAQGLAALAVDDNTLLLCRRPSSTSGCHNHNDACAMRMKRAER
jgi:hypothetical protein